MHTSLDLYLIAARKDRYVLFAPSDVIERCEVESGDRVKQFIDWLSRRPNRVIAWVGRAVGSCHDYYTRLEDRIDPVERVLKIIPSADSLTIHYAPTTDDSGARSRFQSMIRRQRIKHTFWFVIGAGITVVVIALTPILAPIPGPNVFFYYPALRLLSHYRAIRGSAAARGSMPIQFKSLPELSGLEENLLTPRFDRSLIQTLTEQLKIRGLDRFLERVV